MFGGVNETVADWQHLKAFFERPSKLFADLPTHRLYRRFTFFDTAAGQGPLTLAVTMWANKEDLALFDQHHSTHLTAQPHSVTFDIGCHRSEEHTSELQSLMRISYAVCCLKKKNTGINTSHNLLTPLFTKSYIFMINI